MISHRHVTRMMVYVLEESSPNGRMTTGWWIIRIFEFRENHIPSISPFYPVKSLYIYISHGPSKYSYIYIIRMYISHDFPAKLQSIT